MQWIALLLTSMSMILHAHEIQSITQNINLRKQNQTGWQQDLIAKISSGAFIFGAQATYLDRFNLFEKRAGGLLAYKSGERWNFELSFLAGIGVEILPQNDLTITTYYTLSPGLTPFAILRKAHYSQTKVPTSILGIEIEKISGFIFIPTCMLGKATFTDPAQTKDVFSAGLRVSYYEEEVFTISVFGYKGKEASQSIIGRSARLVNTLTGGASLRYHITKNTSAEITFDHTDYDELGTEFHTTTLKISRIL